MLKLLAGLAAGLCALVTVPAAAVPIIYELTGNFSQVGTTAAFAATITGAGNTVDALTAEVDGEPATIVPLSAISLTIGGQTANLPVSAAFFAAPGLGAAGFDAGDAGGILFESIDLVGYDPTMALGPIQVNVFLAEIVVDGVTLSWAAENAVFTARFVQAGVPEPATWAMMIAGFGLTGASIRRRRAGAAVA